MQTPIPGINLDAVPCRGAGGTDGRTDGCGRLPEEGSPGCGGEAVRGSPGPRTYHLAQLHGGGAAAAGAPAPVGAGCGLSAARRRPWRRPRGAAALEGSAGRRRRRRSGVGGGRAHPRTAALPPGAGEGAGGCRGAPPE